MNQNQIKWHYKDKHEIIKAGTLLHLFGSIHTVHSSFSARALICYT